MTSVLLALLLSFFASVGGRDQVRVAQLSGSFSRAVPLLVVAWIATIATTALAVAGGAWIAPMMPGNGKLVLLAVALGFGAIELAWRQWRKPPPREPTRSHLAIFLVLLAHQLGDATRFVLFALAVWSPFPALVMVGGATGGGLAIATGWLVGPKLEASGSLRVLRLATAGVLAAAAVLIGLPAIDR